MYLVAVVVILLVWGIYALVKHFTPPAPPIDDLDEHIKTLSQMNSQKERQRYLRQRNKHK